MLKNKKEKELKQQLKEENPDWEAWYEKEQIQITMLEIEMKKSAQFVLSHPQLLSQDSLPLVGFEGSF